MPDNKYTLKDFLTHPLMLFYNTTMISHLAEESLIYRVEPIRDYFTQMAGMDPSQYAENHTIEYILVIWGIPALAGIASGYIAARRLSR